MNIGIGGFTFAALLLVKAGVVAVIALASTRLLDRSRAASRHAVWATALVVILLLPFLSLIEKKITIPVTAPEWSRVASTLFSSPEHTEQVSATEQPAPSPPEVEPASRHVPWVGIVWVLYIAGALAVLTQFGVGMRRAIGIARRASPIDLHPEWQSTLAGLDKPRSFTRISFVTSSEIKAPVTFGSLHPVVVLPHDVTSWSTRQLHDALVHELAHLARLDWGFQVVAVLACALHWFNPLVWTAARRLQLEAERACDERVVEQGASPHDYAEQLVALTRQCARDHLRTTIAMSRDLFLHSRVKTILSHRRSRMKLQWLATTAAIVVTAGGFLLGPLQVTKAADYDSVRHAGYPSPLMNAVGDGALADVRRLIEDGASVNERHHGEGTPLILAATLGYEDIVTLLIDAGADVNLKETASPRDLMRTPLTAAARGGHRDIVKRLLGGGARVDAAPRGDATALMEAAKNDHPQIVSLLIDAGADVRVDIDRDGNAIIAAARGGNVDIAKMIVRAGADVNAGVPGDGNALIIAVRRGDRRMIDYLLSQGADPNAFVPGDESAMIVAAESGDTKLMRLLLDASR